MILYFSMFFVVNKYHRFLASTAICLHNLFLSFKQASKFLHTNPIKIINQNIKIVFNYLKFK